MYFPDLSSYEYAWPGEFEAAFCGLPVLSVGWLSRDHPFPTGDVPAEFSDRLGQLCVTQFLRSPSLHMMGFHNCEFCLEFQVATVQLSTGERLALGCDEIRVSDGQWTFAAPNLIHHYVTAHHYQPPDAFVSAVLEPRRRQARAQEMYSYHLWEATLRSLMAGEVPDKRRFLDCPPGSLSNTLLGRLVKRQRLALGTACTGLVLMLVTSLPAARMLGISWPAGLAAGALLGFAMLVIGAHWGSHLPCPICGAALKPAKSPDRVRRRPQWHDRFQLSNWLYCDSNHYAILYRLSPFPWEAPPCHVHLD